MGATGPQGAALAIYRKDPHAGVLHAGGLLAITLTGSRMSAMTMFTTCALARFGFSRTLPACGRRRPRSVPLAPQNRTWEAGEPKVKDPCKPLTCKFKGGAEGI